MKKIIVYLLVACIMLTGCRLAIDEVNNDGPVNQDELVGMVVTTEHLDLFDIEAFLKDNPQAMKGGEIGAVGSEYQNRIYAQEKVEHSTTEDGVPCTTVYYNFDHVDGLALLKYRTQTVLEDGSILADTMVGDCSEGIMDVGYRGDLIEGTIYVPVGAQECAFFLNPVYQDAEGKVYLVGGTGISTNELLGSMWTNIVEERTETDSNGETVTHKQEAKITIQATEVPDRIAIVQMSGENVMLDRQEYAPEELPETLTPAEGCAYILVEEYTGEDVKRSLIGPDNDHMGVFVKSDEIYCTSRGTTILWAEA